MAIRRSRLDLKEYITSGGAGDRFSCSPSPWRPWVTTDDVLATRFVCPALDVIDSRYEGFSFKHLDAIADNAPRLLRAG